MFDLREEQERVILVGVQENGGANAEESLDELAELASTAGAKVEGRLVQVREAIHPGTYIGKGKLEELKILVRACDATGIICDDELSSIQLKGLEEALECQIMDLSDDVAYSVHDVEDSIATGAFDPIVLADPKMLDHIIEQTRAWYGAKWDADKLLAAFMRLRREHLFPAHFNGSRESLAQLKNITSDLIGRFCWSVETATRDTYGPGPLTRYSANIVIPEDTNYEIVALKGIAVYFVMAPREREPFHQEELKIVSDLVDVLMADSTLWKASSWPIGMNPPMTTSACASPSIRSQA